jgi:hypothetical protein
VNTLIMYGATASPRTSRGEDTQGADQQQGKRQHEQCHGEQPHPPLVPERRRQRRDREAGEHAPDPEQGVQQPGHARHAGRGRQDRGRRLDRPEDDADGELGRGQDDQRRGQQPACDQLLRAVQPPGQLCALVHGEEGAEDREDGRRHQQRGGRCHQRRAGADQGRPEDERRLVRGALVGERGVDQATLVRSGVPRDRPPADAGERAHLRQRQPGGRGREGLDRPRRTGGGQRDQRRKAHRAGQGLGEDHASLAHPVRQCAGDRGPDGVRHGQGAGRGAARAVAAG